MYANMYNLIIINKSLRNKMGYFILNKIQFKGIGDT